MRTTTARQTGGTRVARAFRTRFPVLCIAFAVAMTRPSDAAPEMNGFELTDLRIPREEILSGGPPRDGIPSIDEPKFIPPAEADFLKPDDEVISFAHDGVTRAYPLRILVWHEVVNDTVGGRPVAVTYCPLCGTAMVFDRRIAGEVRGFGVSGLLYQSDVLMYDRESESLWSQLGMKAVSGPLAGTELEWLESGQLTWKAWREKHPGGEVLSTDTGHRRDYGGQAYAGYFRSPNTIFPVSEHRDELAKKEWVAGVRAGDVAFAFSLEALREAGEAELERGEVRVSARHDDDSGLVTAEDGDGGSLPVVTSYWFAWQAFYPETRLWRGGYSDEGS